MASEYEADLRWFEEYPRCRQCGKAAAGRLRDVRNTDYGAHCHKCANKRLKAAEAYRKHVARLALQPQGDIQEGQP